MAEVTPLQNSHQHNRIFQPLLDDASDPVTPLLLWSSDLESHDFTMERGPRYRAYSELRESKLRMKQSGQRPEQEQKDEGQDTKLTPAKKQVRFQLDSGNPRKGSSILAQSVPDFSSALRKENRKPPSRVYELTPPSKSWSRVNSAGTNPRGSKSASGVEKKSGGLMARKSCVSLEELKGLASAAGNAINNGSGAVSGQRKFMI
ncbi:hypothetical protein CDL15_Pgr027440 [Punica granatum]|uniref:Uncharacterized protein n=1 Tax=Punica granatum TaxID=22663 RepID=A0A218XI93_PUNGR|nr:hypothetical protein CDL15_Pgr027440 [Punica granatum]